MGIEKPGYFRDRFGELTQRYGVIVGELAGTFPEYAVAPGAAGTARKFTEDEANLQQLQADTFQTRSQLEADMDTLARNAKAINNAIASFEAKNSKLQGELDQLDSQTQSARGRLVDSVFLYREGLVSNVILATLAGGACLIALKLRPAQ